MADATPRPVPQRPGQPWIDTDALWLGLPFASLADLLMAIIYYRRGTWREARMTGPAGPPIPVEA